MKFDLKRALSSIFLLSAGFVFADAQDNSMQGNMQNKPVSDIMPQNEITPSANPRVENGADFFLTAEFIYWQPRVDGLAFATTGLSPSGFAATLSSPTSVVGTGKVYEPHFRWVPGFKVGAGLDLEHDGWDLYANYTWLRNNNTTINSDNIAANVNTSNDVVRFGIDFENDLATPNLQTATGLWQLHSFNVIDAEMGRSFFISQFLVMRPSFGLKGTWQKENYDVTYTGRTTTTLLPAIGTLAQSLRYWGVGLRSGMNTTWHFCKTVSFYGDLFVSGVWGQMKVNRVETQTNTTTAGVTSSTGVMYNGQYSHSTFIPVLEYGLGIMWENWFWDDTWHFALSAGWEQQAWVGMNQFLNFNGTNVNGNLVMQGLDVKLRLDF